MDLIPPRQGSQGTLGPHQWGAIYGVVLCGPTQLSNRSVIVVVIVDNQLVPEHSPEDTGHYQCDLLLVLFIPVEEWLCIRTLPLPIPL